MTREHTGEATQPTHEERVASYLRVSSDAKAGNIDVLLVWRERFGGRDQREERG